MKSQEQSWHDYIRDARYETDIERMMSWMYDDKVVFLREKLDQLRGVYASVLNASNGNVKKRESPKVIVKYLLPNFKGKEKYGKYGFKFQCLVTGNNSLPIKLSEYEQYGIETTWQDTGGPFDFELKIENSSSKALQKYMELQSDLFGRINRIQRKYVTNANQLINAEWKNRYYQYLSSQEWREIRQLVINTDMGRCCECSAEKDLQVHHITYENVGNEDLYDLVTLCRSCHVDLHRSDPEIRKDKEQYYISIRKLIHE